MLDMTGPDTTLSTTNEKDVSRYLELVPGTFIGNDHPCFVIAEIGQNHQGDLETAKNLIKVAKECGADCVKFQKTNLTEKFTKSALNRSYNSEHSWGSTYGEHKRFIEFSDDQFVRLKDYAEGEVGIYFTASAMDLESLNFLMEIDVPFIKIGSGDADNIPLLEAAADTNKPLIISTGMQDMESVRTIYNTVKCVHSKFVLLHCVSAYPTDPEHVNLRMMTRYKSEFPDIHIGYSGHELGIAISIAAVALGAKVIERHITLSKRQKGSDHCCSLEPDEFQALVNSIRKVECAIGTSCDKEILECEQSCYKKLYKSLVAGAHLTVGHVINKTDIKVKVGAEQGLSPKYFYKIIGYVVTKLINEDENITYSNIEKKY